MGKIFRISGNYELNGKWASPDPSFVGEIVQLDDGHICGYCNELSGSISPERYLYGKIGKGKKTEKTAIVFLKLSISDELQPLIYSIRDIDGSSNNNWAVMHGAGFAPKGGAKITLEEIEYSKDKYDEIIARFESLRSGENMARIANESHISFFDRLANYYLG